MKKPVDTRTAYQSYTDLVNSACINHHSMEDWCTLLCIIRKNRDEEQSILKQYRPIHRSLTDDELLAKYQCLIKHHRKIVWPCVFIDHVLQGVEA